MIDDCPEEQYNTDYLNDRQGPPPTKKDEKEKEIDPRDMIPDGFTVLNTK